MHGMCIGAAEPIGAAPKTDTFKSEKPYAEPIGAAPNDPCPFRPTSNFVRCSYVIYLNLISLQVSWAALQLQPTPQLLATQLSARHALERLLGRCLAQAHL